MHSGTKNIALVVNPTSEKAQGAGSRIAEILSEKHISFTLYSGNWSNIFDGFTEVWIVGGDGTLNYFINQYPDIEIPLAIFKGGTGNDFHWMLYGDVSVEQHVERVLQGNAKMIDAARCNERIFLNNLGIGFDAKVSKDLIGKKKKTGKASYMAAVLKNIFFFKEFLCSIRTKEEIVEQHCLMVSICNGRRTGGGFYVGPLAVVDDGLLDLTIVGKVHPLKRIRYLPLIEKGEHLNLPFVKYQQITFAKIKAAQPVPAHVDGEFFVAETFEVVCLPKRFLFIV